jgi:tetratricopeptide (TPR) repeat protein
VKDEPATHLSEDLAAHYADDTESLPNRPEIEEHLHACKACSTRVEGFRGFVASLREEETWWLAGEISESPGHLRVRRFAERIAAEDAQAERLLAPLLESQYQFTYANIARRRRFHNGGVVRLLCRTAWEECAREPIFALSLAESAAIIAEALPDDYYPAGAVNDLRGTAWKEASTAHRLLGQLDAAFDALKRAERAYRRLPDSEMQMATVEWCRAILHWERQQYDDALTYARSAASRFEERRDTKKYLEAKEWEAIVLHSSGDVTAARSTYLSTFELADTLGDADMKARAANNLGMACRDAGETAAASQY